MAIASKAPSNGGATDFRSWLLRIATNAVNDYLRDAKRRSELVQKAVKNTRAESDFAIDCRDELIERKALLKEALLSLKPKYQTVITLRFFENMKLTEIAACLGKNFISGGMFDKITVQLWGWANKTIPKLRLRLPPF